jgi:hypothetical protein
VARASHPRAAHDPLEGLVGDAGICHRRLALELVVPRPLERLVDLRIHARDEEAPHRGRLVDRLAVFNAPLEALDKRLRDRLVALHGEQAGDVHVDAQRGQLLERLDAFACARDLDQRVGPVDLALRVPNAIVIVHCDRVVDFSLLPCLPDAVDLVLERELRRVNPDDKKSIAVGLRPRADVPLVARPVDPRQCPEVHQDDVEAQLGGAEWL